MADLSDLGAKAPLVLVGAGKMGGALMAGWLAQGCAPDGIIAVRPSADGRAALSKAHPGITVVAGIDDLPAGIKPRAIMFAVKPQKFADVLPLYKDLMQPGVLVISVAAGITIANMQALLGECAIIRSMPNTPSAVGEGMTALIANDGVSDDDRSLADSLLGAVGKVVWLDNESQMNGVTAVSGSGPAYVFHMVEAMAEAGKAAGLSAELAMALARQTIIGAGALMAANPSDAATLRKNVTSPGGTTEAALNVLMKDDALTRLMTRALGAAAKRSKKLAG